MILLLYDVSVNSYRKNYVVIFRSLLLVCVSSDLLINFCFEVVRSLASSYNLLTSANSYQKNCVVIVRSLCLVRTSFCIGGCVAISIIV